jgi:trehalose-6-phosphatase
MCNLSKGIKKMEFNESSKRRVYSIDLDGTLTNGEPFWEVEPTPKQENIDKLRNLYKSGNIIIIWSARQWECAPDTVAWLIKNRIPFHGIYLGKGGSDYYIDDKNLII